MAYFTSFVIVVASSGIKTWLALRTTGSSFPPMCHLVLDFTFVLFQKNVKKTSRIIDDCPFII